MFVLLAILTFTGLLSILPGYPAVILAFVLWGVLPGWWLQRALVASRRAGPVEQAVLAFVMSMALAAVPGLLALRFHWSLEAFAMAYALLAAVVSGMSLLWPTQQHQEEDQADEEPHGAASGTTLLLILVAVPLLAIATSPWWAGDRIARDADDLVYTGYVTTYMHSNELDASAPFFDARPGSFSRMEANVWLVTEALIAKTAGVEAFDLHMHYLPGILTILAVAAVFALAKGLFGSMRLALFAAALILVYAFLDLAPQEGFGRMLLLRMAQDKMAASFIFVPAGILLGAWYLERPSPSAYVAVLLAAAAALVVHPLGLMSLGIALASVAVLRVLVDRTRESFTSAAYLVGPWLVLGIGFLGWSWLFAERVDIFAPYLRRKFNVTDVPGGMIIGNYHLLLHPMVLAAIVLAVPAWLLAPRRIGNQVLLGLVAGVLLIFFVPFIATPIAAATREEAVWRLHRLIPVALILACVLHFGILKLSAISNAGRLGSLASPLSLAAVPAAGVLLVFVVALLIQEQYAVADDGSYYNRTSQTELLPWTGGSIFLGGAERAVSSDFRPTELEARLLDTLAREAPPGAIVLAIPDVSTRFLESVLNQVRPIDYFGAPQILERRDARNAFFAGDLIGEDLVEMLNRFHVDYVVLVSRSVPEEAIQAAGGSRLGVAERVLSAPVDEFAVRQGEPELIAAQSKDQADAYTAWAFGPDGLEEIVARTAFLTIPDGAAAAKLNLSIRLAPSASLAEYGVARLVVTLETLDGTRVVGDPVHTVANVYIGAGSEAGVLQLRVRTPAADFSAGERYRIRVWRDGEHEVDTYPEDVWFVGVDIGWYPQGAPLGSSVYEIYSMLTN
ncbi:MAG: hypothetical protein J4N98_07090 [Chloroflexi bacterium]|nr:hypothetical protein [Chloroflexota bacterium]